MTGFTSLEIAVLTAISSGHAALGALLDTAQITERENTGHGFYTSFSVDRHISALQMPDRQLNGPNAYMNDMGAGMLMGFILWFEDGYPDCLEGFQYSDSQGNTVDLKTRDLTTLTFMRLEPLPPSP
ncbi:MAG: hypothetical protein QM647_01950 [Asticcacaulis sp.]|uniref:hypothetical protein n=1 Tax=Asticcacaulis sp. TaxID=1872648 RepID=UPI0039E47B75